MDLQLLAQVRTQTGKGVARRLRAQNKVPAVFYGPSTEPQALTLTATELEKVVRATGGETRIIPLVIDDGHKQQKKNVFIRDMQLHPFKRKILHVDFYEVAMDQAIVVEVPVELTGEPVGIENGGILNQVRMVLSVQCLPGDIPDSIPVDVSHLDVGESIHVADLKGKYPFELVDEDRYTVVTINAPAVAPAAAEEAAEEAEEAPAGGEEVTAEE